MFHILMFLPKIQKQSELSNIISYIYTIELHLIMKLNRIKDVLAEKGISQTWLAKQLDKSLVWSMLMLAIGFSLIWKPCNR